jgi:branched-chain amino acid transport system permease protein
VVSRRWRWSCCCCRIVNSPFGSVLMAIRENPFRPRRSATAPWSTAPRELHRRRGAALAGALLALWSSQTNPDTTLSFDIMVDILLMVVIGGMGTMYGAVIGAVLLVLRAELPQGLVGDRWLLWLGVAFILCVYFFPTGIVGRLRRR